MDKLNFKDKKITILGLGLHGGGLAITRYLAKKGAILTVTDLKNKKQLEPTLKKLSKYKIQYTLGKHSLADFRKKDMIIQNPGVPRESLYLAEARKNKIPIENEASLFFKMCPAPIIAISGTRGKSTTTGLIYEIFKRYNSQSLMAGNIREVVMFDIIDKVKKNTPVILELSSWQLEILDPYKLSPHIGVLTNIMPDHLNRYKNFVQYIKAKEIIFKHQKPVDYIVLNKDNKITRNLAGQASSQKYYFSLKYFGRANGSFIKNKNIFFRQNGQVDRICSVADIKLPGEHNLANVLAAVTTAKIAKISNNLIIRALRNYKGLPNRLELIREYKGIKFYNDTTSTTPDAALVALKTLAGQNKNIVLLAGGSDKKLNFAALAREIKKKVKVLILFNGLATEKLHRELVKIGFKGTIIFVNSMPEAFSDAKHILETGDIFLLSLAAASFGLFNNEFDRGEQFRRQTKRYK